MSPEEKLIYAAAFAEGFARGSMYPALYASSALRRFRALVAASRAGSNKDPDLAAFIGDES